MSKINKLRLSLFGIAFVCVCVAVMLDMQEFAILAGFPLSGIILSFQKAKE